MSQHMQEQNNTTTKLTTMTESDYIRAFYECGITIPLLAEAYGKTEEQIIRIIKSK